MRVRIGRMAAVVVLALASIAPQGFAQIPTITGINPSTVTAGSPAFLLTVTGTNYSATSTVSVNTFALVPSSQTATQLLVTVPANLVTTAGPLAGASDQPFRSGRPAAFKHGDADCGAARTRANPYQRDTRLSGTR